MTLAIIIPTRAGSAGVDVETLRRRWSTQTLLPDELIIVSGANVPGVGRNKGAEESQADVLIFADDDGVPCHPNTLQSVIAPINQDDSIWLSAAAIRVPTESNRFQLEYARQIPQNEVSIPDETVDSVLAYSLCCAIKRQHFEELNGFDERLSAGEDSDFRDRIRRAGGRAVLAAGAGVFHPPPDRLWKMIMRAFWYGAGEATIRRLFNGDDWRSETRPKGIPYIILKAIVAPACLILDWDLLRDKKMRFKFQPLRLIHVWAMTIGYLQSRLFGEPRIGKQTRMNIQKVEFRPDTSSSVQAIDG